MASTVAHAAVRPSTDERFRLAVVITLGVLGWIGVLALASVLAAGTPSRIGFDLRLVLDAGSRVASGRPIYDPAVLLNAAQLQASDLFYSYPPVVAQLASLVASVPVLLGTLLLGGAATLSAVRVGQAIAAASSNRAIDRRIGLALIAALPFVYPFTIAILFGNLDGFYAAGFGLVLLAALRPSRPSTVAGGLALGLMSVAKLHPALLGLWLAIRGLGEFRSRATPWSWVTLAVAALTVAVLVAASLLVFGRQPWLDYVALVQAISAVQVVLPTNIEPAAQLGLVFGTAEGTVRALHLVIVAVALVLTALAAWRLRSPLVSLAFAAAASLVVLPLTWFHYPAALIPFGVAASASSTRARPLVLIAILVSVIAIGAPVMLWLAVALVIVASALTGNPRSTDLTA